MGKRRRANVLSALILITATMASWITAAAQTAVEETTPPAVAASAAPLPIKVLTASTEASAEGIQLGELLILQVQGLDRLLAENVDCDRLILFLDGFALDGLPPVSCSRAAGTVRFLVERNVKNEAAWDILLGRPRSFSRNVAVTVGIDKELPVATDVKSYALLVIPRAEFLFFAFLFVIGALLFYWRGGAMLRSPTSAIRGGLKCFSLARVQMAVWFGLVIAAYVFIWLITGELDTLNDSALVLIGLGAGTGLTSAAMDASRLQSLTQLQAQKSAIAANSPQADQPAALAKVEVQIQNQAAALKGSSAGFFADLLRSPGTAQGVGLDRFQLLCWTVILGTIFVVSVYRDLSMPEFSPTLLALMGISSGTFLGFKLPNTVGGGSVAPTPP